MTKAIKRHEVKYTDIFDLFCQFTQKLELSVNEPSYDFMQVRMDFLAEEVEELQTALNDKDDVEIIDGAADVAFIAITQIYHAFRNKGKTHNEALLKTKAALMEVGLTNIIKVPPTEKGAKIQKPEGWESPRIAELLEMTNTLKKFLEEHYACEQGHKDLYDFAKDLTLEQFFKKCERGDWILCLFQKTNPESLKELTLAKGHCANTVRHLMRDERSVKAVDVAIAFGEGKATKKELDNASYNAYAAADGHFAAHSAAAAGYTNSDSSRYAADDAAAYAAAVHSATAAAKKKNQQQTADICRKYLPLEIWDQELINKA